MKTIIFLISIFLLSSFAVISQVVVLEVTKATDPDPYIYPYNVVDSLCAPEMYGTVQWATRKANDLGVPCRIVFNIPGSGLKVINLNYQLPVISVPIEIDGTTQPGYVYPNPQILLKNNAGSSVLVGLAINGSSGSKIKGIAFMKFWYTAIQVSNCTYYDLTDNVIIENSNPQSKSSVAIRIANSSFGAIYGNYLGLTPDGVTYNNVGVGVFFTEMSSNNTLGGTIAEQANTIANHSNTGIQVNTGSGNKISGNKIFNNPQAILLTNGGNLNKQAPVISSFNGSIITGKSTPNDIIEIFGSNGSETANEYITTVFVDANGDWTAMINTAYPDVIATATDSQHNTSAFSSKTNYINVCKIEKLTFSYSHPVSFSSGDSIVVTIILPSGIVAYNTANINTGNVIVDTSNVNKPTYKVYNMSGNLITLDYYIFIGCEYISNTTQQLTDSIFVELNNTMIYSGIQNHNVNSPWIVFEETLSQNITYNTGLIHIPFTRTYVYKNTGNTFSGDFLFRDTTYYNSINTAVNIIGIECLSSNTSVLDSACTDTSSYIKLSISNLQKDSLIIIRETVRLVSCPESYNNICHFNSNYGCSNDSLCIIAQSQILLTVVNEDPNDKPIVEYDLLTLGYPTCWNEPKERIVKIKNTGQGIADTTFVLFYKNGSVYIPNGNHITENLTDSVVFYKFDGSTYTSISNYTVLDETNYCIFKLHEPLNPGDSIFLKYVEVIYCIDSGNYSQYFNHDIYMHFEGLPQVKLWHKCNPTGYHTFYDMAIWRTWEHTSRIFQVFHNYTGTMNGGDEAWFDVPSSTPLYIATPCIHYGQQQGFIFSVDSSAIQIKIKLDSGLGLVTDSLYIISSLNGIPLKLTPFQWEYDLGTPADTGNGNVISAYFAIPDSFYTSALPNSHGYVHIPTSYYHEYFANFKVVFKLKAYCEHMQNEPSKIIEDFFFIPNRFCNPDCKLPLSSVNDKVHIHCPGCVLPGWNLSEFEIKRKNVGFADNNNNNFPDSYPMTVADTSLIQINNVIIGDTLVFYLSGNTSDGGYIVKSNGDSVFVGFGNIDFDYTYGQMLYLFPMFDKLRFLETSGTLTDGTGTYPFNLPPSAGTNYNNAFTINLDISTLQQYGLPTSFNRFWANNTLTLKSTFVVKENLINPAGQNPYFNIEGVDARMNMSGTPYPPGIEIKLDAGTLAEQNPDSFLSLDTSELAMLNYWCTGWNGRFGAVGLDYSFNFHGYPSVSHVDSYFGNFNPCRNIIRYSAYTEMGHQVYGGYSDQDGEQIPWNAFSYEIRNLWMLDSIQIQYPLGYILDSVIFVTTQLTSDGANTYYTCNPWLHGSASWHDYDMTDAVVTNTNATIYPSRNFHNYSSFPGCIGPSDSLLTAWDETKRYRIFFVLKNNSCAPPEMISAQNYDIISWWSDFPGTLTGDTVIIHSVSGNFTRPLATLNSTIDLPITQDAPNSDISFDMNISTVCDANSCGLWDGYINNGIAINTFILIHSPSGTFIVDSVINSQTGQILPAVETISGESVFGLGMVGYQNDTWIKPSINISVFSSYDCANITGKDSVMIYTGWNCEGYPNDLNQVCYLDSQWLSFPVVKPGMQANLIVTDTLNVCDTLYYNLELTATGTGNVHNVVVNMPLPQGGEFSYLQNTAALHFDGIITPVNPIAIGADTLSFILNTPGFDQETANLYFTIVPGCSFYNSQQEVELIITAQNFCGNDILIPSISNRPSVITGLPAVDSLFVSIDIAGYASGCGDTTLVTVTVTNLSSQLTGASDTLFITLPPSFTWAGGDMYFAQNGQSYSFRISSGIANNSSQTFQFGISGNVASGNYPLYASVMAAQVVPCTFDTCIFPATMPVSVDTAEVLVVPLQANVTATDASCGGVCNGTATVTCSGIAPFTYYWSTGGNGITENNICAGNHYVIVQDAKGCSDILYFTINTAGSGLVVSASSNSPVCEGSQLELFAEGGTQYEWSGPAGFTSIEQNPVIANVTNAYAGTYYVTVTDAYGCTETAETIVQIVSTNIIANFIIDPANIIQGSPVFFTFDGINADSVTWEIDGIVTYGFTTNHTFYDYGYYCLTLTAGNICAQVDTTMTLHVFPATCTLPQTFHIHDGYEINGGVIWDNSFLPGISEILVEGDIIIKPFSSLIIQNKTVLFSSKGRIIVERSAGLSIENSTLTSLPGSSCGMWQGIEVWGRTGSQVPSYLQGQVFITGNSTISNAHIGVLIGKRLLPECGNSQQYPFDLAYSGGKIFTTNTTFNRNGMHIRFTRRNDPAPYGVMNYICNNNFYCQGALIDSKYSIANAITYPNVTNPWAGYANANTRTDVGIMFTKHKYIILTGNRFDNSEYGIFGTDNQYNVFALNTFSNHRKGILGISTLSTVTSGYRILTNTFDYIPGNTINPDPATYDGTALYILGGVSDGVSEGNIFRKIGSYSQYSKGILFDNSNNFEITNNYFENLAIGTKIINSNSQGGFVRATASTNGLYNWRGNQYEQCFTGVETEANNQNLCIRCNDYMPSTSSTIFNWQNSTTGTLANQGFAFNPLIPCSTRKRSGAGNIFANNANRKIYSETPYTYYHHTEINTRPEPHGGGISLSNILCANSGGKASTCLIPGISPSPITIGIIQTDPAVVRLDSLSVEITALELQYDNLQNILDNGKTIDLLNAIYANPPSGQLKNLLLNNSPLSDTVLIALNVTNPLAPGNYKDVMEENLPVSRNVLPSFLARVETFPPGLKNQLKEKQAFNPGKITTGYLEAMIGQTTLLKKYYFHEILKILLDTANIRKEDAIALYEREGSAESKMIVAATYLSDGDYVTAASKIAALPETTQEIIEWKAYANILLPHLSLGKEIEELDSVQIEAIRTIAWLCPASIATANARALLLYLNREEVPPCPETGTRNKQIENNSTNTSFSYLGDNYPDPFSGNTVIPYYLPENTKGEIVIMDALGREVKRYILKYGENKINVDSRNWQSGIYFYSIVIDGNTTEHKKMIKAE